jgi:hypothetical protein
VKVRWFRIARLGPCLLALAACQEKLATPTDCPELCPGNSLLIRDTVITARVGLDSTFTGYLAPGAVGALLVSNGLGAGEARAFAVYAPRPDTVLVDGVGQHYTIDSVVFTYNLVARDTSVHELRLIAHRIPPTVTASSNFAEIDTALTPESLIDSVLISDTLKSGSVRLLVKGDALERILPSEADSGKLGVGVRINAAGPTGVRLGAESTSSAPVYITYVHAAVSDTAKQRQQFVLAPEVSNYVIDAPPPPADRLFLGGKEGSRLLLRFTLPQEIKDSAGIVRATLELTLAEPLLGLPNDPGDLQIRGVLVDLGAKSPALANVAASSQLIAGSTGVLSIDMRQVVATWLGKTGLTPTLILGLSPDGGTFSRPEFLSTLSGAAAPRIRITYALFSHPGHP